MSNSDLEDSVPHDKTQQLLRKHLMTPFKYTVACSLFDTVSKYVLYSVCRQIQTELETESHLSPGLSPKPVAFISKSGRPGPHAFVPRVPSPQAARGACSQADSSGCKLKVTDADTHPHLLRWRQPRQSGCKASLQQHLQVLQQHHKSHKETEGSLNLSMQARPASVRAATHHILPSLTLMPFLLQCPVVWQL